MLRVISELKPTWVLGENVPGIVNMALDQVLSDLENISYETQAFIIPACGVDAPHQRKRVFIVAHSIGQRHRGRDNGNAERMRREIQIARPGAGEKREVLAYPNAARQLQPQGTIGELWRWAGNSGQDVADAGSQRLISQPESCRQFRATGVGSSGQDVQHSNNQRCEELMPASEPDEQRFGSGRLAQRGDIWPAEPNVGRVAHGVPKRVDRLRGLGNAVVPQQAYPILQAIADIERGQEETG